MNPHTVDSARLGEFLQQIRERNGLKRSAIAAALDMGEQNIRYYESGRNRLPAEDIPRFADAYRMTPYERQQFAALLHLVDANEDAPRLTQAESDELDMLRKHPEFHLHYLNLARTFDEMGEADKRGLLEALRLFARYRGIETGA